MMECKKHHLQPKEMYVLALIEMCQRFAFWGIGNLLVLFLVQSHGFSDAKADHLYGIFSGVAFILPLLGGFLADRTSHAGAVTMGALLTAAGCLLLATEKGLVLYIALACAAAGAALFTPSIYTILGKIYHEKHHLREGGFSIYYAAVNVGVFLATFILGSLGSSGHWSLSFTIACLVQLFGLFLFLFVRRKLQFIPAKHVMQTSTRPKLTSNDKSRILVIIVLSLVSVIFWIAYNQGWSSMSIFTLNFTDRHLGGFVFPPSWILSSESLFLVILAFPLARLYRLLVKKHCDPNPITKTILSLFIMGLCFLVMAIGSRSIPHGASTAHITPLYPLISYFLMAIAEMLLAPIGLSLVTHLSPHGYTALLVGIWYVCIGIAFYLGGFLAGYMAFFHNLTQYFDVFTFSCIAAGLLLVCGAKKLNAMRHMDSL